MNNVECPEALLGTYRYNITTDAGTFCSDVTTATINACDVAFERTHIIVDNSGCSSVNPFNTGVDLISFLTFLAIRQHIR